MFLYAAKNWFPTVVSAVWAETCDFVLTAERYVNEHKLCVVWNYTHSLTWFMISLLCVVFYEYVIIDVKILRPELIIHSLEDVTSWLINKTKQTHLEGEHHL